MRRSGASAAQQAGHQTHPFKRVLVVDDDLLIRQLNAAVLNRFGYRTKTAEDGAAAWKALQANSYDLLVTDHNMPKVSGIELVKKVHSAQMALPVILASGDLPWQELGRNPWLQPVATLAKPITGDQLLATVTKVLGEADSTREQIEPLPTFSQGNFGIRALVVSNPGCP
jgi:two-component system, chemotaxis family, sensor histidine kinase and response regulator WspE